MKTTKMRKITSSILAAVVAATCLAIPASSINYSSASAEDPEAVTETEPETEGISEETSAESTENSSNTPFYEAGKKNSLLVIDESGAESNRTYNLYQVFKGKLKGGEMLTNIQWGESVYIEGGNIDLRSSIVAALKAEKMFDGNTNPVASYFTDIDATADNSAEKVSEKLEEIGSDSTLADAAARIIANVIKNTDNVRVRTTSTPIDKASNAVQYEFKNVASGYYLVSDETLNDSVINSRYMLKVGTDEDGTKVYTKSSSAPKIEKNIRISDTELSKYQSVAIGQTVKFELTSTVPNMSGYNRYYFVVNDTMTSGLTLNKDSFVVTVGTDTLEATTEKTSTDKTYEVEVTTNEDGSTSFTLTFKNFKQYTQGSDIKITYTATVNKNIVAGENPDNVNTVNLTYPNNPNFNYQGDSDGDPDKPKEGDPTVTTPDESVYVYTTSINMLKIDSNGNRLSGAEFTMKTDDGVTKVLKITPEYKALGYYGLTYTPTTGEEVYYRLDSKTYASTDDPTQVDRVAQENVKYKKTDDEKYEVDINGEFYKDSDTNEYVSVNGDGKVHNYVTGIVCYKADEKREVVDVADGQVVATVSTQNGIVQFSGLGEGTYYITETKAPDGYNAIEGTLKVEVKFKGFDSKTLKGDWQFKTNDVSKVTVNEIANTGVLEVKVINSKNSTLPTTGGIGTTIFYIVGSVIVIGAVVLLITKRRMRSEDE
jgi:fimbrial isopeptide formation D2 family protein/LPXTG-motif cell wall-anchored protein